MLITYDFVFRFEYEDAIELLRSAYGLNWPEKVITKNIFVLKITLFFRSILMGQNRKVS